MIKVVTHKEERLKQGDIIKNVDFIESAIEANGIIEVNKIRYPYVLVMSQDCDLEQDFNNRVTVKSNQDKFILSVIVVPIYNVEHIYTGEHLSELAIKMRVVNGRTGKTENKNLKNNEIPRYHYIEFDDDVAIVNSVLDFKHFFTVSRDYLTEHKTSNFICCIDDLFRERISQRFANYLSRIGLPEI